MQLHTLKLADRDRLSRAFGTLLSSGSVEDCLVESASLRIRFVARPDRAAELIERIERDGGLSWSTRSDLRRPAAASRIT
jgi:hypothetical protein